MEYPEQAKYMVQALRVALTQPDGIEGALFMPAIEAGIPAIVETPRRLIVEVFPERGEYASDDAKFCADLAESTPALAFEMLLGALDHIEESAEIVEDELLHFGRDHSQHMGIEYEGREILLRLDHFPVMGAYQPLWMLRLTVDDGDAARASVREEEAA
ncbi:hypothetical protein LO749_11135 [Paracoccus denitrificans]|uniref:hypothetical protein n=1 Tax=Paracoccus denitrificans TaxID=266 RepID=UPI001E31BD58|nr:hypothetical protein [Paracoccus denitrificans]UFS64698.1 hypothetical protein LO749_11135 [Paracoccus denitrificans]